MLLDGFACSIFNPSTHERLNNPSSFLARPRSSLFGGFSALSTGDVCRRPPPGSANSPGRSPGSPGPGANWKVFQDDGKEKPWETNGNHRAKPQGLGFKCQLQISPIQTWSVLHMAAVQPSSLEASAGLETQVATRLSHDWPASPYWLNWFEPSPLTGMKQQVWKTSSDKCNTV